LTEGIVTVQVVGFGHPCAGTFVAEFLAVLAHELGGRTLLIAITGWGQEQHRQRAPTRQASPKHEA